MHRKIHITASGFTTREIPMNWFLGFICSTSAWVTQVKVTCHFNHAKCPFYQSQIANFRTWFQHKDQSSCKVEHDIKVANFYEENTARHTQGRKRRLRSTASRTRGGKVASFLAAYTAKSSLCQSKTWISINGGSAGIQWPRHFWAWGVGKVVN